MKTYHVEAIELETSVAQAFDVLADPAQLPLWTHAFASVGDRGEATMRTPRGELRIGLEVRADAHRGTVDWVMTFPDGATSLACSRLVPGIDGTAVLVFVLLPPPGPLEELEGALEAQAEILRAELGRFKELVENGLAAV